MDVVIVQDERPFDDARQIAVRFLAQRFDDMVIVAPLSVIKVLCDQRIKPLWSEVVEENDPTRIDFRGPRGQGYRFIRFRRITRVAIEFEEV